MELINDYLKPSTLIDEFINILNFLFEMNKNWIKFTCLRIYKGYLMMNIKNMKWIRYIGWDKHFDWGGLLENKGLSLSIVRLIWILK